jgi:polysaccharide export outer membrane protein
MKAIRVLPLALLFVCVSAHAAPEPYRVGPGDVVQITVWGHEDMNRQSAIAESGAMYVPLLGKVPVAGLTCDQIGEKLARLLADGFLRDPQVDITVVEYNSQRVYIHGELRNPQNAPGTYILRSRTTLLELIATYGGTTEQAGSFVIIVRKIRAGKEPEEVSAPAGTEEKPAEDEKAAEEAPDVLKETGVKASELSPEAQRMLYAPTGKTELIKIQLTDLLSGQVKYNLLLQPGDIILIPPRTDPLRKVFVVGDAKRTGPIALTEGMTLAKLITMVGVPVDDEFEVSVYKSGQKKEKARAYTTREVIVEQRAREIGLEDGDFVYFQRSPRKFYVVGQVKAPGAFYFKEGITVREAVVMAGWTTPDAAVGRVKAMRLIDGRWVERSVELDDKVQEGDIITVPERWF